MPPSDILKALGEPFPRSAIKTREGARGRRFEYIETHTAIHRLNSAAGAWDFHVKDVQWRDDLIVVLGELTIPGLGTRSGFGVQKYAPGSGEDLVKGAVSDALKKAATMFGVALDLYGPDYEAGEVSAAQPAQNRNAPRTRQDAPRREEVAGPGKSVTQRETDAPGPNTDAEWQRASRRLHAVAKQHGIPHESLSDWAFDRHKAQSLRDVPPEAMVQLANVLSEDTDAPGRFLQKYPPVADEMAQMTVEDIATITGTPIPGMPGSDRWTQ